MANHYFEFKQFTVWQAECPQKVSTDACLFGAWTAKHCSPQQQILDIGAGTGLLMLMLAQKHKVLIDGIEINSNCAAQLKENLSRSPWGNQLNVVEADVKTFSFDKKYDLIISNPPFYENQLKARTTEKNMAWHSSELLLTDLINIVAGLLTPEGRFSVLIPYSRLDEALFLTKQHAIFPRQILTVRHTQRHPFTRSLILFSRGDGETKEEIMEIRNEDGEYSSEFAALLADYYLFL